ncbi:hypothetical protein TRIUR3_00588 [Triticum urartu]|uniref:Uncharacterized protein n=1 Tax=Triticum urartu TaxID=4572 RepID=M7Z9M6_TRIUA|nr:hypothetical protein TRIUR3_00588 [Triticum urartu]
MAGSRGPNGMCSSLHPGRKDTFLDPSIHACSLDDGRGWICSHGGWGRRPRVRAPSLGNGGGGGGIGDGGIGHGSAAAQGWIGRGGGVGLDRACEGLVGGGDRSAVGTRDRS